MRTEEGKKVGLWNGDSELEEASQLCAVTEVNKVVIYIIIAQFSYEVKLGLSVTLVALVAG